MEYLIFLKSGNYIGVRHYCDIGSEIWIERKDFVRGSYETEEKVREAEAIYIKREDVAQILKFSIAKEG